MKKEGFISHIHEESQVAEYISQWLKSAFLGQLDLFVSSMDLVPGNWLTQIQNSLKRSAFVFPLLSKESMKRPWINFESGSAFMSENTEIIPLCHMDLSPSGLIVPYSYFQAYDLRNPKSVYLLIGYLANELKLDTPNIDPTEFCEEINRLDKVLYKFFPSFADLKLAEELLNKLDDVDAPLEISINEVESWNELDLRYKIHNQRTIEASGYTRQTMGFNIYNVEVPKGRKFLLVEFENTANSTSHDLDKLLKLNINRDTVNSYVKGHIHYNDDQFTLKGDGFFAYELPPTVKEQGKIEILTFAFWKIELHNLLMRLYVA